MAFTQTKKKFFILITDLRNLEFRNPACNWLMAFFNIFQILMNLKTSYLVVIVKVTLTDAEGYK